ncbi:MAG: TrmH family RNA methyltransferase [Faecalibacterium sp.]
MPGAFRPAGGALSGGGPCGRQAGRRGHPSGGVRCFPHSGAYLGRGEEGRTLPRPRAGAGPRQLGTLLRSAAAFGFDGVLLSDGCASVFAPKTLRASMGAAVRIPVIEAGKMPETIARLRALGITCLAAALYQSQPLSAAASSCPDGVCVVIGSEGQGLTDETIAACTGTVRIPMTDRVESLNAGIAGSILLWHFREESL